MVMIYFYCNLFINLFIENYLCYFYLFSCLDFQNKIIFFKQERERERERKRGKTNTTHCFGMDETSRAIGHFCFGYVFCVIWSEIEREKERNNNERKRRKKK